MCGIAGEFRYGGGSVHEELLARMRDTMSHRGPDGAGLWLSRERRVGLAHRRLSIVDLSDAGRQPMTNEDGTLWITYNGEIYNHEALRKELEPRGHVYRSRSDTETLLHGWEEWGEGLLDRLEGMFAFALWDEKKQELFLARDRIGVKPLYWTQRDGRFLFASEIKALLEDPETPRRVDPLAVERYLSILASPAPRTFFQGIEKLPAGTCLRVDRNGRLSQRSWWIPPVDGTRPIEVGEAEERLQDLLEKAVRKRLMADVPFGVFLSGGVDSSLNVALMTRVHSGKVRTFTVGWKDSPEIDETKWARLVAERFGTEHHEVFVGEDDMLGYLESLIWHQDEPNGDSVCVPLHFVSDLLRKSGTIVVQVGEGSDEQFSGYHWSRAYVKWARSWGKLSKPLAAAFARGGRVVANGLGVDPFSLQVLERKVRGDEPFLGGALVFHGRDKARVLGPALRTGSSPDARVSDAVREGLAPLLEARPDAPIEERMLFWELRSRLPELLLMRVDKVTMGSSVEARVPFLDHHVVEWSSRLPLDLKLRDGEGKWLLKRVAARLLPREVVYRKKQGFAAPESKWFRGRLGALLEERLRATRLRDTGLVDFAFVDEMLRAHREGRKERGVFLWTILVLVLWFDRFIERR